MQPNLENQVLILIVDDHAMSRAMLRDWVEFLYPTCQVLEAENGQSGLEAARTKQPHLILLDLRMPIMNGYEMALALREWAATSTIPLVLCTCEDLNDSYVARLRQICHAVLSKPFSPKLLQHILQPLLVAHPPVIEIAAGSHD